MNFLDKVKHKATVIFNNIKKDPDVVIEAAAFGILAGGQMGFNISVMKELKRLKKADQLLADIHMEFVNHFNTKFVPAAQYNADFAFEMIEVISKELDTVKPGAYDTIAKAADNFDKLHHGPCYPNG